MRRYLTLPYLTLPYLTLPSGEDVLPPSAEASNGPSAHPRINHEVTKSPSVVLTWVHTNNGTIPPSPIENTHLCSTSITHSQYMRENVNFKCKSTLVTVNYKSETREITERRYRPVLSNYHLVGFVCCMCV